MAARMISVGLDYAALRLAVVPISPTNKRPLAAHGFKEVGGEP